MKTEISRQPTHVLVACEGHIDGKTAPELQATLAPLFGEASAIVLDLSKVDYMSSAGLRVLLLVHRQLVAKKGRTVLVGLSESLTETMRITGFLQFFETQPTLAAVKF
ncbi:anti-sigma B factor antagonist [Opitutaceae bacterium EW11]|nr:anti-sigma B factor antagonist [Opitutaceae bacterium EW11]